MTSIKGKSTGVAQYDKRKFQQRRVKFEREVSHGVFNAGLVNHYTDEGNIIPTQEQIARKMKREAKEAKEASIRLAKRRKGSETLKRRRAEAKEREKSEDR